MTHLADFGCIVGNMMIYLSEQRTTLGLELEMFHMKSFHVRRC